MPPIDVKPGNEPLSPDTEETLKQTFFGRIVSALMFITVIFCLAVWITGFLLLRNVLLTDISSGNVLTNLTCIFFFGGLIISFFIGALAGNFLRRVLWKMLIKRNKQATSNEK
jgi:hypothetical protein